MKEPNKQIKKSYRSINLHKFGQEQVQIGNTNIYLYVHICITNGFECEDGCYYIIKYLGCVNNSLSKDKSIYLPTKKLDLNVDVVFQIKLDSRTILNICKVQTLINPNLLLYKINYMYLPKLDTNINTIKKLFDLKQFYYISGLNQKKLIEYKEDEINELEKLLDDLNV